MRNSNGFEAECSLIFENYMKNNGITGCTENMFNKYCMMYALSYVRNILGEALMVLGLMCGAIMLYRSNYSIGFKIVTAIGAFHIVKHTLVTGILRRTINGHGIISYLIKQYPSDFNFTESEN